MNLQRCALASLLLGLAGLTALSSSGALAQGGRQYYGPWSPTDKGYHYCFYYHKPHPDDLTYKHHYAIHFTNRPNQIYFYNPVEGVYWGRYDCPSRGYSKLAPAARQATIAQIPEKSFPAPAALPPIPQAKDNAPIAAPPPPPVAAPPQFPPDLPKA